MSNSIWETPEMIIFYAGGCRFPYLGFYNVCDDTFGNWKTRDVQKWAYVNEITEEADKAERLQKIAERQNEILQDNFATLGYYIGKEVMDMSDEIKQLIKE